MLICSRIPLPPTKLGTQSHIKNQALSSPTSRILCSQQQSPKSTMKEYRRRRALNPIIIAPDEQISLISKQSDKKLILDGKKGFLHQEMMILCALGYYVNGFRGFPWLALNFHMAHNLNMNPSTLQIVQNMGNLPMVAKPFYGILSDALYIGGAHRIPYVSIGVVLQALSWGSLALIPAASKAFLPLMACVLLTNFGASIAEVAKDALIAEYGQYNKVPGLQSYALMASAVGGVLGNLLGGIFLVKALQTKSMFLAFAAILVLQLTVCLKAREDSLGLPQPSNYNPVRESIPQIIKRQYSDLMVAIKDESVSHSLIWIVSSILLIPALSGSIFCYHTQCLNLDSSVIGMSKVTGQLMLLSLTILYDRFGKNIPMRKLASIMQISYAFSLLLDMVLVKQINIQLGISNEVFALCFSGLAEVIAQFKLLPFYMLFASLAPSGCEGSLLSFVASALCLSSIFSGFLGVGLASFLGITSGDYSNLPLGIMVQFLAALLPLRWIGCVTTSQDPTEKNVKKGRSKRTRRTRRVGRVSCDPMYSYRRERESDLQR
ncbi:hypothetical protein SASPL_112491 [Salvia splendens]|uniref:Uncharacterized protein n=1 Tax=Salvia splendens TaxID=180675 RepID=A0A8X8YDZ2_SALSN|nr:probable folate-biopterin transporter 9, chloroplastic [Salvia splendens]KAG6428240.1 hypothetical protein SASPL_112491 [Salvia splendens]